MRSRPGGKPPNDSVDYGATQSFGRRQAGFVDQLLQQMRGRQRFRFHEGSEDLLFVSEIVVDG